MPHENTSAKVTSNWKKVRIIACAHKCAHVKVPAKSHFWGPLTISSLERNKTTFILVSMWFCHFDKPFFDCEVSSTFSCTHNYSWTVDIFQITHNVVKLLSSNFNEGRLEVALTLGQGFPGGSVIKNLPAKQETQVWYLSGENPQQKEMATNSSSLAWEISWTEEFTRLQKSQTWLSTKQQQ